VSEPALSDTGIATARLILRRWLAEDRPSRDFDHPRIDPVAFPQLVRHVLYRISRAEWTPRGES
jgi:hypothetical protein